MSFENPDFNIEPEELEQKLLGLDFLQEQVRLPKNQWDEKFRNFLEEKIRENRMEEAVYKEETPETMKERSFRRCIEGLGLDENILKGKKVLDLGSGDGEFVKSLIEKGITSEAYGIDTQQEEALAEDEFKQHFFKGNFENDLPVKNADYVVSVGAVSNGVWGGEESMDIRRIIENSLASLKEGGEIRIYPIQEAAEATPLEGLAASQRKWKELLADISKDQNLEYRIEPRDVNVIGKNNDIILESVLILRRSK